MASAAFLTGNCGSGRALGSGDVEKAGPAYTSTAAAGLDAAAFLPWCLRPAGGDLLVVVPPAGLLVIGLRCDDADDAGRIRRGAGSGRRMLCGRRTSVAIYRQQEWIERKGGRWVGSLVGR